MGVVVELDVMLARRKMSVGDFAAAVGITPANVAVLKNGRARAIRFSTLDAICRVLDCQPGDILRWAQDGTDGDNPTVSGSAPTTTSGPRFRRAPPNGTPLAGLLGPNNTKA
ncbi:MAG TPA: helix-turn-helix transcriptional regulator [Gemmatimonadaceae bacterium]|jgi:putative transcriptional regulator